MRKSSVLVASALLFVAGYLVGNRSATVAHARFSHPRQRAQVLWPSGHGDRRPDRNRPGLRRREGVIRFVSVTGMKEGELARYDQTPTRGGIPKSYGRLVTAVVNSEGTGLIFEDSEGVIRFVTIAGKKEGELTRN